MSPLLTAAVMYALGVLTGCALAYIVRNIFKERKMNNKLLIALGIVAVLGAAYAALEAYLCVGHFC